MAPIIRICKLFLALSVATTPFVAAAADQSADLYWFGQRAELARQDADAVVAYRELLAREPGSEVASNRLLEAALRNGNFNEALRATRAGLAADVADTDAQLLLFVDAYRRKKWSDAERAIGALDAQKDFAFMVPILRNWLQLKQGRDASLSVAMLRDLPLSAYYGDDQLIYTDLARGNLKQAQLRFRAFRGFNEVHGRQLALYAIAAMKRGQEIEFATALEDQIGVDPANPLAPPVSAEVGLAAHFARLAIALDEQKQPLKGLYFARLASWVAPSYDAPKLVLAELLAKQGLAKAAKDQLASIGSGSAFWMAAIGQKLELATDAAESVAIANAAALARPEARSLKLLLGRSFEQAGKRAAAIDIYRGVIAADEQGANQASRRGLVHLLLASALDAEGRWDEARIVLEKAVTIDPDNAQALNYLGYSLLERREDIQRGFELVERAHQLVPQSAAITDSLGWGHFLMGNVDKAIPLLEAAARADGGDPAINEHLGDAYWRVGRRIEARFAWKAAAVLAEGDVKQRLERKIDLGWSEEVAAP